jgi:hypothetical protein
LVPVLIVIQLLLVLVVLVEVHRVEEVQAVQAQHLQDLQLVLVAVEEEVDQMLVVLQLVLTAVLVEVMHLIHPLHFQQELQVKALVEPVVVPKGQDIQLAEAAAQEVLALQVVAVFLLFTEVKAVLLWRHHFQVLLCFMPAAVVEELKMLDLVEVVLV